MGKAGKQGRAREALRPTAKQPAPAADRRQPWRRHGWRLLAIWGLVAIAYSNSFQSGLVFDNSSIIGRDPRIRQATPDNIAAILHGGYRYANRGDGLYRPLTTLSYLANYAVLGNGPRPAGYHWVNLVAHEVNVALVYALAIAIFGETAPAWALAAVWGVHPLLTESVTNVVGRADLFAAFGVLAGLLCHVRAASAAGRRRLAWLGGVAVAQAIGLFSKESAVVLPALMLLYDLTRGGNASPLQAKGPALRSAWLARAPAYAALALPLVAFFYLRGLLHPQMVVRLTDNPLVHAGFWTARLTAVKVIGKLLWLYFWPARLSADYSYNAVPLFGWRVGSWEDAKMILAMAVCLGAALLTFLLATRWRRVGKPMLFFLIFFFVSASPTSNLVILIGSIMAERFLYLPSVGVAGFLVASVWALSRRRPPGDAAARIAWAALGIVCLALAARTYARNFDWKDEVSLWTGAVNVSPDSGKAHYNLAQALERVPGRLPDAVSEYRTALRIDPGDLEAHTNLGNALASMPGGLQEAIAEYQAAMRIDPGRAEPHNGLANVLSDMPGRLPEAITEYREALRIQPADAELHYNLANALFRLPGRRPEAIAEYRVALRIAPDHAEAHMNLGNALSGLPGTLPEAIAEYRAALRINPGLVSAHINLANAVSGLPGGLPEAIAEYQAALRVQPDNAEAHYDLGTALERIPGRLTDAIAEYRAALRIAPNLVEAHVNLGNALAQIPGRQPEAISEYEAALRIRPDPVVRQMADRLRAQAK